MRIDQRDQECGRQAVLGRYAEKWAEVAVPRDQRHRDKVDRVDEPEKPMERQEPQAFPPAPHPRTERPVAPKQGLHAPDAPALALLQKGPAALRRQAPAQLLVEIGGAIS